MKPFCLRLWFSSWLCSCVLAAALHAEPGRIYVHANDRVALLELSPADFASLVEFNELNDKEVLKRLSRKIYASFDDVFDFVFIELSARKSEGVPHGTAHRISNAIRGIGQPLVNECALYGSRGRLKSVVTFPERGSLRSGPGLHEVVHAWGNYILKTSGWDAKKGIATSAESHWGFTGGSDKGQLGGFKQSALQELSDGSFRVPEFGTNANGGNGVAYSDLELYLMGLIPPEAIAPFDVFRSISHCEEKAGWVYFRAVERVRYDGAKLMRDAGGPRVPSHKESQKHFRGLLLQVWDRPYESEGIEWTVGDNQAAWFEKTETDGDPRGVNFWEATRGLATIQLSGLKSAVKPGAKVTTDVR